MIKMEKQRWSLCFTVIIFSAINLASLAKSYTDPSDVIALVDLYRALELPGQLKKWNVEGGDPCKESWTGVTCHSSSVIHLKLKGLNLTGSLGTQLHYLRNLKHLDFSHNFLIGEIPYGLPPNATHINLASNNLTESIPHSLPGLKFLRHLNLSHNLLSGPVGNVFRGLDNLNELDLSFNAFSKDLPSSFKDLKNLTSLFLQNNNFTGSVVYLAELPLKNLNIQSNHFSGVIPFEFQFIPNLWIDGNKFYKDANYPPWGFPLNNGSISQNFNGPQTIESSAIENRQILRKFQHKKRRLGPGGIACVVGGTFLAVACAAIVFAIRVKRIRCLPYGATRDRSALVSEFSPQLLPITSSPFLGTRHIPSVRNNWANKMSARKSFTKNYRAPESAKIYTVAELQSATNFFSEENLIGEGSLGSVYKAVFPDDQVFAVKNINMVSLSFAEEEQFLDVVWMVSRLRHPNIVSLLGYCVEHGQHLLVYEYLRNLSLEDILHGEEDNKPSWNNRLKIALGAARALNYLHTTFSPPVAHGNIKAANVLLDEDLMPRLSDCGIAVLKLLTSNSVKAKAAEIAVADTGYIAPDHWDGEQGNDNTKTDVYAFGVLLLELLTGRRPFDSTRPRDEESLVKWASSKLHDREYLLQMVDPSIRRTVSPQSLSRFADVISLCIQPEKLFRPPISEIVESLTNLLERFTMVKSSAVDGAAAVDPFDNSFRSTQTRFMGSPTLSITSNKPPEFVSDTKFEYGTSSWS